MGEIDLRGRLQMESHLITTVSGLTSVSPHLILRNPVGGFWACTIHYGGDTVEQEVFLEWAPGDNPLAVDFVGVPQALMEGIHPDYADTPGLIARYSTHEVDNTQLRFRVLSSLNQRFRLRHVAAAPATCTSHFNFISGSTGHFN